MKPKNILLKQPIAANQIMKMGPQTTKIPKGSWPKNLVGPKVKIFSGSGMIYFTYLTLIKGPYAV